MLLECPKCAFGGRGHSKEVLGNLDDGGRVPALDGGATFPEKASLYLDEERLSLKGPIQGVEDDVSWGGAGDIGAGGDGESGDHSSCTPVYCQP